MRDVIHEWWPVAAVTLFTLLLVTQIPRKVIFPPVPEEGAVAPFASFVTLDDDAYAAALQSVRMSWQLRARTQRRRFSPGARGLAATGLPRPAVGALLPSS